MRYENEGTMISVELSDTDYEIFALVKTINKTAQVHCAQLYLKRKDIVDLFSMFGTGIETQIKCDGKIVKSKVTEFIEKTIIDTSDFFKYIKIFEYQLQCFDIGNEIFEKEGA